MKTTFYPRLAWDGLRKNRQLAWPYLLTCICMVAMLYILGFLASPGVLALLPMGRSSVEAVLTLGQLVMAMFSLIFLFYTHSFLLRRRAREFGLYNVLGMSRRNLARIVTWESVITALLALAGGLVLGVGISKLAELGLVNLMGGVIDYRLRVDAFAMLKTAAFFLAIFGLIWLATVIRTLCGSAVSLMKAESVGERPPKGNWLLTILGLILLGLAYWLAVSIDSPLEALMWFFVAVLMVIAATYLLMIAGSVRLCRVLQANRDYYYRPRHFVSVSSMAYRMKRNGAGLASICIIATMVLVILSATTCLWFGTEDAIVNQYPREINLDVEMNDAAQLSDGNLNRIRDAVAEAAVQRGTAVENAYDFRYVYLAGELHGSTMQCDYGLAGNMVSFGDLRELYLVSADDYAARTGKSVTLADGDAMIIPDRCDYSADTLTITLGNARRDYRVARVEKAGSMKDHAIVSFSASLTVVVPDLSEAIEGLPHENEHGRAILIPKWVYGFDTGLPDDDNEALGRELSLRLEGMHSRTAAGEGWRGLMVSTRAAGAADYYASNGSLFFIGILLSAVFLLAAVLIIYYKQISEGYEDAGRFEIMRKVGMTKQEIRRSISSQLLTVFALPLAFAGLHLVFAFPMIRRVLKLFSLYDTALFVRTTLISFAVFALFYGVVYRLTSGVYYRIVSKSGTGEPA